MSFIDKMKKSKKKMNLIRWNYRYILAPSIILVNLIALIIIFIVGKTYEDKILYFIALCFSFIFSTLYLIFVNKKVSESEVKLELDKHNFDYSNLETKKYYQLNLVDVNGTQEYITFMDGKLHMFGQTYDYDDLWFFLVSNNEYKTVNLDIKIYFSNPKDVNSSYMLLVLDNQMLMILDQFDIKVENYKELQYLLKNKEDAFKQILKYSKIKKVSNT